MQRMYALRAMTLIILVGMNFALFFLPRPDAGRGVLTVAFLDIGQGDAIYIEAPSGAQMLIDGGPNGAVVRRLGEVMSWSDRSIDVVLATHPDTDHIGGLPDVLRKFDVDTVLTDGIRASSTAARAFDADTDSEHAREAVLRSGAHIALDASTTLRVLAPTHIVDGSTNDNSIVLMLTYGDTSFLLTGDAPASVEHELTRTYGSALRSDVLKVGHHGSDTSSAAEFLVAVAPAYSVISVGAGNRYGHPTEDVLERLAAASTTVLRTDEEGTVIFRSDGKTIWREE